MNMVIYFGVDLMQIDYYSQHCLLHKLGSYKVKVTWHACSRWLSQSESKTHTCASNYLGYVDYTM